MWPEVVEGELPFSIRKLSEEEHDRTADPVPALDQALGQPCCRRRSLYWPVLTIARMSPSVNVITSFAAQKVSSADD
jgi:hypothetical protein